MQNINRIEKESFPYLLKQITALPKYLDVAGKLPDDNNKFLCVIGSRIYSDYGRDSCQKIIGGLKGYPIVIVSGLALGIDSIAHEVAIKSELKTVSFPGSGLSKDVLYPSSKISLAERIVNSGGALISPFEYNQIGTTWTFPNRNRLMAGMSHATLIIEARKGSGTLLTAKYAEEFNRDIMAVPGSIFSEMSYGPHMLIKSGAYPITDSKDILNILGFEINTDQTLFDIKNNETLTTVEKQIIHELRIQKMDFSLLIEKLKISSIELNIAISRLELEGYISESNGSFKMN